MVPSLHSEPPPPFTLSPRWRGPAGSPRLELRGEVQQEGPLPSLGHSPAPNNLPGSRAEVERRRHISNRNQETRDRRFSGMSEGTNITMGGMSSASSNATGAIPNVTLEELAKACNNWDEDNKIGEGGYGTVFKARWRHQDVAIKRIRKKVGAPEDHMSKAVAQVFKEIRTLSSFR